MKSKEKLSEKLSFSIDKYVNTSAFIFVIIIFSILISILVWGLIDTSNELDKKCVDTTELWSTRTDLFFPNVIWVIFAFGFVIHGFSIISISNKYNYGNEKT